MKEILIAILIVTSAYFVLPGCASTQALDYLGKMTTALQPAIDASKMVCSVARYQLLEAGKPVDDLDEKCAILLDCWRTVKLAQETAIVASGGAPCNGCK